MAEATRSATGSTVDPAEAEKFERIAASWWDPTGDFAPLHRLNPVRIAFVRDRVAATLGRDPLGTRPLDGVRLVDIGCGGGLIAEPMARLGARVLGIDVAEGNIAVARRHAAEAGVDVAYRVATAEDLAAEGERFDVVLALEVVEHVADVGLFLDAAARLMAPGGTLVLATINRTAKSFLFAKVGAEYVLRWLPRGTHQWRRFLKPSEVAAPLRRAGLAVAEVAGVAYDPLRRRWQLGGDLDVNYMLRAARAPERQ